MTIADLLAKLAVYPADARVTLLDPDRGWMLPIHVVHLPVELLARIVGPVPVLLTPVAA
jgi:hypothetical protein